MKTRNFLTFFLLLFLIPNVYTQQGGYALQFDGTNDYVDCGAPSSFRDLGQGSYTIEAWIRSSYTGRQVIFGNWSSSYSATVLEIHTTGNLRFYVNGTAYNSTQVVTDGNWHHVAGVRNMTTGKVIMYVDGKEIYNQSGDITPFTGPADKRYGIGANPDGAGFTLYFNGKIDEVRIWNTARTEAEIKANMYKETGTYANLKAYYKMSNGTGTTLTDNSGNSNTGTLTNEPAWKASGCFAGSRQALDFDGTDDNIQMTSNFGNAFNNMSKLSFAGWVYPTMTNARYWGTFFSLASTTTGGRILIHEFPSADPNPDGTEELLISISQNTGAGYGHGSTSSNILVPNRWEYVAFVYDGTQTGNANRLKLYVNGKEEPLTFNGTIPSTTTNNYSSYSIGGYADGSHFKGGKLDEFSFWNVALTENQIKEIMFKTLEGNESGLFAYYRFDQSDGTTLYDMTSNGYNGTLTNMDATTDWVSSSAFNTWIGGESNAWATNGNWSNGDPASAQSAGIYNWSSALPNVTTFLPVLPATVSVNNLLVPSGVSASGNVNLTATGSVFLGSNLTLSSAALNTARDLVVESGKTLTIPASGQLTVSKTLINSAGNSGLVIESGGSLIHNTNNVAATVKREISGNSSLTQNKYHFVSIPTQYASPTSSLFLDSYLYKLDPTQLNTENNYGKWIGLGTSTITPLALNQGYMVYYPNTSKTYTFEGNLNNGTYTYSLTGHSGNGVYTFNLIPNPYSSSIVWNNADAAKWPTSTGVGGSCYIWNSTNGNYTTVASGASSYIPAGQAFMVLATNNVPPTLSVSNNARLHSSQAFYKSGNDLENRLVVTVSANNYADETVVKFAAEATEDFDLQTDGLKLYGLEDAPQLYTLSGDQKYSINNLPVFQDQLTVDMNFETSFTGEFTLSFEDLESFNPSINIFLKDELTNQTINIRNQQVYTFIHNPENAANRFKLVFGGTIGIEETEVDAGKMWINGNTLYINASELNGQNALVEVYNPAGQRLLAKSLVLDDFTTFQLSLKGFVLVNVTTGNEVMTAKGILTK